ncbi:Nse1 non-SMC component of SMC5-6 complex-domain-containing protein [Xylariaceae sp. FL0594]|nr:Nse1 non-SMC component of SMC5-6 complex-domain-containing protein [Xylariaceae sp. FL0594]
MDEDQEDYAGHYDDANRAFLQAFMARGTMTFKGSQPILAAIFSAHEDKETRPDQVTQEDFASYVSAASAAISPFDMEIRSMMHQSSKNRIYAIVNTTSDPMTQLATLHSPDEIAFVKRVIDAMFENYNTPRMEALCLNDMQANKLRLPKRPEIEDAEMDDGEEQAQTQSMKGLKSSEVESVMQSMVDEGWFECSRDGFYCLSTRALLELRSWLIDSYNDPEAEDGEWQRIKFCEACKDIVTIGQRCAERDCLVRLHDGCAVAFFRNRQTPECPKCSREWTGKHFVGERAVTETEAYQRGRRRSGKSSRKSNLAEEIMLDEDEDVEDADGDD